MNEITVSIVSHKHGKMVQTLLDQLCLCKDHIGKIVVTFNVPERIMFRYDKYPFEVCILENKKPKGFGANHNQAFRYCKTKYFCVMNPDINIIENPFLTLLSSINSSNIDIIAPLVVDSNGNVEDSARTFPTPWGLFKKAVGCYYDSIYNNKTNQKIGYPDWIAGMFMLIDANCFKTLSGFDESYFLYYEDVDLCLRAWRSGMTVALCNGVRVIHDASRESHRNLKFFMWHLKSVVLFFFKHAGRFPRRES